MVILIEKNSPFFDKKQAHAFFEKNKKKLDDVNGFDYLLQNSLFWNVYDTDYIGSVFIYQSQKDDRFYLGGYAKRKKHKQCVEAVKLAADSLPVVYADTRHLNAVICLLEAGFKWVNRKQKLLKRYRKMPSNSRLLHK